MSKADIRAIVDVKIDWITQKVFTGGHYDCHQTDEWKIPQRGAQDCLLDRIHLCGNKWDFTSCLFMNQLATFQIDDNMRGFNATVEYCSYLWNIDHKNLTDCAYSDTGAHMLQTSHEKELEGNSNVEADGTRHPNWLVADGVDYGKKCKGPDCSMVDWLKVVCDAYTGSPKPASCSQKEASSRFNLMVAV
mmetsp:Transcript_108440/g.188224  ORF Transcript_108440/g.188224 Transcript_108440/m.188224 type:complete len:190 (-) Transcript_108440:353-922(-)